MAEFIKEPQKDCIFCQESKRSCRALSELYCVKSIKPCSFYKSKYEYDEKGKPLKGDTYGICRD